MGACRLIGAVGLIIALQIAVAQAADVPQPGPPFVVPLAADGIQRATITLDSYSYTPNHVIVESGKPVELILTSITTITPHNFIIKELSVEQDVSAGKTVVVKFTPTQTGVFPIYCDKRLWPLPSHRDKGMEGKFEVK
ncbi:MAG: cupredoxin domain-containing protein [Nitrospira sp.]|nr:cupredoxin domain-containing protein [Nitrospira sp.]